MARTDEELTALAMLLGCTYYSTSHTFFGKLNGEDEPHDYDADTLELVPEEVVTKKYRDRLGY